ncbi:MAG: Helix-turn-helix domain [Pseudomonadota bacterium]
MQDRASDAILQAEFGARLAHVRVVRGYASQAALARALGIAAGRYNVWEKGEGLPQTIGNLLDLCRTLRVTSDYLLFGLTDGLSRPDYYALVCGAPSAQDDEK